MINFLYIRIEWNWDAGLGVGLDLGSRQSRASRGKHFSNVKKKMVYLVRRQHD
jgi:hypothetical protein